MQWVLLATAWTTFSKFLPNFCAEGFFRRILGKKHRIPPLFKKKNKNQIQLPVRKAQLTQATERCMMH